MAKTKTKTTDRTQQLLSVNKTRHAALEILAEKRRKTSGGRKDKGALTTWQDIANEAIDEYVS